MWRNFLALALLGSLLLLATADFRADPPVWDSMEGVRLVDQRGKPCFADMESQRQALAAVLTEDWDEQGLPIPRPLFDQGNVFTAPSSTDRTTNRMRIPLSEWADANPHAAMPRIRAAFQAQGLSVHVTRLDNGEVELVPLASAITPLS